MAERVSPCDRIMVPVFLTYRGTDGLRADKEMFAEHRVIVLRWYADDGMHQRIVVKPTAWRDGKNYFEPDTRKWKYG